MLVFTNMRVYRRKNTKTRQAEIVKAALDIIGERGVSGVTTARIAGRLGITEPSLYRHFKDKEAILSAVIDEIGVVIMDRAAELAAVDGTPAERLRNILYSHIREVEQRAGIPRLIFSEGVHIRYPRIRKKLVERIGGYMATVERLVAEGMADGTLRANLNVKDTALTFLGMVQFAALRWSLSGFAFSLKDEGGRLWRNYLLMVKR